MSETLVFVSADEDAADEMAAPLAARGWDVQIAQPEDGEVLDRLADTQPLATIFNLGSGHAEAIRVLASSVVEDARIHRPLLVFTGGSPEDVAELKQAVPFGVFVRPDELFWVLKHLAFRG